MRLSVILTTRDGSSHPCPVMNALTGCLQPGDEIIAVDAGSGDGTAERLESALARPDFAPDIRIVPILLASSPPDRAIPLNIGIGAAKAEAPFLLGDGLPDAAQISAARGAMEAIGADLLISVATTAPSRITGFPPSDARAVAGIGQGLALTREEILMHPPEPERMIFRRALLSPRENFAETSSLAASLFRWGLIARASRTVAWSTPFCLRGSGARETEETHDPCDVPAHYHGLRREGGIRRSCSPGSAAT
jgi:glycosyltransferase involved in cell wall biosynthesis